MYDSDIQKKGKVSKDNMYDETVTLYLDTSIPSAYYDTSKPVRQLITQKWFEHKASRYRLYTSVTAIDEIDAFGNLTKRQQIKDLLLRVVAK